MHRDVAGNTALFMFSGLFVAVLAYQVYRGVVAFRHPERPTVRPAKTRWPVWLLALLCACAVIAWIAAQGARVFR